MPLDPTTWVRLLSPYWTHWPELLQDLAAETWPGLEPRPLAAMPRLPADLAELWDTFDESTRSRLLEALNRGDATAGRKLLNDLVFTPPRLEGCPPQEVRGRIVSLSYLLLPETGQRPPVRALYDDADWSHKSDDADGPSRRSVDRVASLEAINRGLAAIANCLRRGDEARARQYLEGLIDDQDSHRLADTHVHLAKTLSKAAILARDAGLLEWSEELHREACHRNPNHAVAASGLADALKARGELEAAERQYRDNIDRWPNNAFAACGLADVLKARGELEAAERQYRDNVKHWPNNEVAANGLAEVLKTRGELGAAMQHYRNNIDRWPNNEVAANGLADVLKARGELEAAARQYRENVDRWPKNVIAANGLGEVLKTRGELEAAERKYRDNIIQWPKNEVAANGLADVLKARGELAAAEQQYRDNIDRWPDDAVARHGLANVLRKQRRHAEALHLLPDRSPPVTAQELYNLHLRGMILLELGRWNDAVESFERGLAAAKTPDHRAALQRGLVLASLSRRDFQAAIRDLEALPNDVPRLDIYRLHATAGDGNDTEARSIQIRLRENVVGMDFATRIALHTLETAYCLDAASGLCRPGDEDYAAIIDVEIDMEEAA